MYNCDFLSLTEAYAAVGSGDTHAIRLLRLQDHADTELLSYDPSYDHNEARLSADGTTLMLFRPDGFRLCDMDGEIVADVEIPDGKQVYDQQYIRDADGSRLEVTYYDGMIRAWSAEDGALLWERQGDIPDTSANEVFYTDHLRIDAPLHGTPTAYDLETGREVAELETDAEATITILARDTSTPTPAPTAQPTNKPSSGTSSGSGSTNPTSTPVINTVNCSAYVVDPSGNPIADLALELHSTPKTATTNQAGNATFGNGGRVNALDIPKIVVDVVVDEGGEERRFCGTKNLFLDVNIAVRLPANP